MDDSIAKINDPALQASRLFVGGWSQDKFGKQELIILMSNFGNVRGVHILNGCAFVQFERENEVSRAIQELNNRQYNGVMLNLRPAAQKNDNGPPNKKRFMAEDDDRRRMLDNNMPPWNMNQSSNNFGIPFDQGPFFPNQQPPNNMSGIGGGPPHNVPSYPGVPSLFDTKINFNNQMPPNFPMNSNGPPMNLMPGDMMRGDMMGGMPHPQVNIPPPLMMNNINLNPMNMNFPPPSLVIGLQQPLVNNLQPVGSSFQPPPATVTYLTQSTVRTTSATPNSNEDSSVVEQKMKKCDFTVERPFDAVIVVTQKGLKLYAEMVERRLLELNMVVDMIFLLNEKALNKAIDDMTCRGVLYILVVQPQHEEHKSITVNIMHGTPQEHRNMPLEDALVMLARNFNTYLYSLRIGGEQPTMGFLFSLLTEGKHLSVAELDRIIAHLSDRRDRMIEAEGGRREKPASNANNTAALQQKLLSLVSTALLANQNVSRSGQTPPTSTLSTNQNAGAAKQMPTAALANMAQQFGINLQTPLISLATTNQNQAPPILMNAPSPAALHFADPSMKKTIDSLLQNPNLFKTLNVNNSMAPPKKSAGKSGR